MVFKKFLMFLSLTTAMWFIMSCGADYGDGNSNDSSVPPNLADGNYYWWSLSNAGASASVSASPNHISFQLNMPRPHIENAYASIGANGHDYKNIYSVYDWSGFSGIDITYSSDREIFVFLHDVNDNMNAALLPAGTNVSASLNLSDFNAFADRPLNTPNHLILQATGVTVGWESMSTTGVVTKFVLRGVVRK